MWRFSIGLGKKVILANTIGELFDTISNSAQSELSVAASWLGIIAYTFQIYFDFSGYSDMAIGLGKMFGFDFLENLQLSLHLHLYHRFLETLAYVTLKLVQRFMSISTWR